MTNHDSGFVEVSDLDIAMAIEALSEEQVLQSCRGGFRMSDDERAQHEAHGLWLEAWTRHFSDMLPGRIHFAKADMQRLRGILFSGFMMRYVRRYRMAMLADTRVPPDMITRIKQMSEFETRMWNPEPFSGPVICFERAVAARTTLRA